MIPEKLQNITKQDGVVAIATLGADGPHPVNTRNSHLNDQLSAGKSGWEDIGIIPATQDSQLADIADLAGRIWRVCYPGIISPAQIQYMLAQMYSLDTLHAEIRTQKVRFHQLLVDGRLTGFAAIGPTGTPGVLKLHKLYIAPESHGLGLGKRLLNHCEAEAAKNGARRLILAVNKRNARAIAFYQRNGLAIIESVVSEIGGGFVMADFIMAKEV